jgi:hypothetical protein
MKSKSFGVVWQGVYYDVITLEEAEKLESQLKRANMKLDTIDAVAKQLVHMTNLATNNKIKIDKVNEILNGKDSRLIMDLDLFLRVREVLKDE